jgi:hypothetical protein
MAHKELKEALRSVDKVLTDQRVEHGQRDQLLKARCELVKFARGGKADRHRVFRSTQLIAEVLLELLE